MDSTPEVTVQELEKGVRMDIVISEPSAPKPAALEAASSAAPTTTAEDINKKLDEAAERRNSLIADKQASLSAHLSKIEEIHKRKNELDEQFIKSTKEALEQKLESAEENRIATLNELKAKVKEELDKITKHQTSKEQEDLNHAKLLMGNIHEKLETAAANRDQNMQNVIKRLRDHEESVNKAVASQKEQLDALKERIQTQLEKAAEKREAKLQEIVDAAKEREKKVEMAQKLKKEAGTGDQKEA